MSRPRRTRCSGKPRSQNSVRLGGYDGLRPAARQRHGVDAGISLSQKQMTKALSDISRDPVSHLINTHWHFDHGWKSLDRVRRRQDHRAREYPQASFARPTSGGLGLQFSPAGAERCSPACLLQRASEAFRTTSRGAYTGVASNSAAGRPRQGISTSTATGATSAPCSTIIRCCTRRVWSAISTSTERRRIWKKARSSRHSRSASLKFRSSFEVAPASGVRPAGYLCAFSVGPGSV